MDRTLCIEFYSIIEPVRAVQIKAQAMQTFVIIDVYVMLYSLYTTVLDVSKPLKLIVPVRRQFDFEDPDLVSRSHDVLQPPTHEAQKLLSEAMSERYFKRYYLILALRHPRRSIVTTLGGPCY
jgi:hypothetical protein